MTTVSTVDSAPSARAARDGAGTNGGRGAGATGEDVMDMLTTLNDQGATIMMVTHSLVHAQRAHRIVHMLDGRIVTGAEAN